jgi:hypothetical protein
VRYTSLAEMGINLDDLTFQPMPERDDPALAEALPVASRSAALTIGEAKRQLAMTFGVKPEAIEITIRG